MRCFHVLALIVLALAYTLLNAVKPLTIDDAAYFAYAQQAANHPLDPYGFAIYWWSYPEVANEVLAPPLLSYWWSLAIRFFGDNEFLWKLWLFPFAGLFVLAVYALSRRFARGIELSLTALMVLSPTFLPSLNLMLDVPALALSLAALELFCRACDRNSFGVAALAGLIAGLAMQTKYTAFLCPATMLLYSVFFHRLHLWPAAAFVAAQLFLSWELLMSLLYSESHFLYHTRLGSHSGLRWHFFSPLVTNLGTIAWPTALLGLAALRVRRPWLIAGALASVLAFTVSACYQGDLLANENLFDQPPVGGSNTMPLEHLLFGIFGVIGLVTTIAVTWCVCRLPGVAGWWLTRWDNVLSERVFEEDVTPGNESQSEDAGNKRRDRPLLVIESWQTLRTVKLGAWRAHPQAWFLFTWLLLELLGYFMLTPFAAVRRLMAVVIVGTFLAGRLAALTARSSSGRQNLSFITAYSALLAGLFFTVDLAEARAQKEGVETAAAHIREEDSNATIWYVGHWGFQHYANKAGLRPIVAYDLDATSAIPLGERTYFRKGDWLVLPRERVIGAHRYVGVTQQPFEVSKQRTELSFVVPVKDQLPWHTIICYYSGRTAIEHHSGNRVEVEVRRVTADHWASSRRE